MGPSRERGRQLRVLGLRGGFGDQQGQGGGQAGGDIDRSRRRGERHIALTPSSSYTPRGRRFSGSNGDSAITFAPFHPYTEALLSALKEGP